jgi:hypothetical protein
MRKSEGLKKGELRRLRRFKRLAAKEGTRMRALIRPILESAEICKNPDVHKELADRRAAKLPRKGWKPPTPALKVPPLLKALNRIRKRLAAEPYRGDARQAAMLAKLPSNELSLLRAFLTMGKRIGAMVAGVDATWTMNGDIR